MKKTAILLILLALSLTISGCEFNFRFWEQNLEPKKDSIKPGEAATLDVAVTDIENDNQTDATQEIRLANEATLVTNLGEITVKFYPQAAPKTVANFTQLSQNNFYNQTRFHRVIKDFMIQGGDPLSKEADKTKWGTGGPGYTFEDEINDYKLTRGKIAMANAGANTNGSQFFIVTAENTPWLDGKHTVFGEVISGMDIVDKIQNLKTDENDRPLEDVIVEKIELKFLEQQNSFTPPAETSSTTATSAN